MAAIFLLGVGICILTLLIILALFFIPVITRIVLGLTPDTHYFIIQVSWGWIGAKMRRVGFQSRQEFLIGDHPYYVRTVQARGPDASQAGKEFQKTRSLGKRVIVMLGLIRPLLHFGKKLFQATTLQEIRGNLKIGFQDPVVTGLLYGGYCAILPALKGSRLSLDITPTFDRAVMEGKIMASVKVNRPLFLILPVARLFLDGNVRRSLSALIED